MSGCKLQASGAIELYFYDELESADRASVEQHVSSCAECRRAFEELSMIRAALSTRPLVEAPPTGDWTAFMSRLDDAIRLARQARAAARVVPISRARRPFKYAPYFAVAALVILVTSSVVYLSRKSSERAAGTAIAERVPPAQTAISAPAPQSPEAAFAALSEQHFERSKLVVLGLANKDAQRSRESDWAYERELASTLLSDTRMYRLAAEERGMKRLAGVMGDLELVLLQTALAEKPDPAALEQIQRLIHKRDLMTKMDVATTGS